MLEAIPLNEEDSFIDLGSGTLVNVKWCVCSTQIKADCHSCGL